MADPSTAAAGHFSAGSTDAATSRTMTEPSYPPARAVASRVLGHITHQAHLARERGETDLAPEPDLEAVETIIDVAFWASLRREEGYTPTISLAFLPPDRAVRPLIFEPPVSLAPNALARLAPAVKQSGIHLGVWRERGEFCVWGTTRALPALCFVLEVVAPGLLVVKYPHGASGKFVNIVVIEGDQVKVVDEQGANVPDCPAVVSALLGFDAPASWAATVNVFVRLAVSMRAHGRGGALLVVRAESGRWRQSIVQPIRYSVAPPFREIAELMAHVHSARERRQWQDELTHAVDAVAGLTAVDGATVMNDRYELLAFAVKIARHEESARVQEVMVTEPVEGIRASKVHPAQLGGTRHLSAAQFVYDQRDASALVASQDGRFTIFQWSPCEEMVHAHRVEALLL
jgi:sensor domain DACNV-containing protein